MTSQRPSTSSAEQTATESTRGTIQLSHENVIHCGPENSLLRHVVGDLVSSLKSLTAEPNSSWLPLVLYGDHGCGKSLIAHGLAAVCKAPPTDGKTKSESDANKTTAPVITTAIDIARALKKTELSENIDRLSKQLRSTRLLVIDDVQLLARKPTAQEWLASLLDHRIKNCLPTLVTANGPVASPTLKLSNRLRSRMSGGLAVRIALPLASTRKEVILAALKSLGLSLTDEQVIQLIDATSGKPVAGIRSMVASVANSKDSEPTFSKEQDELFEAELIQKLLRSIARKFGVTVSDLKGPSRRKNTALARAVAMFLLRELTPLSLHEIGTHFRNRDHTTVRHAYQKLTKLIPGDEQLRQTIISICNSLDVHPPRSLFERLDESA